MKTLIFLVPLFLGFFAAAPAFMWWGVVFAKDYTKPNGWAETYMCVMMATTATLLSLFCFGSAIYQLFA